MRAAPLPNPEPQTALRPALLALLALQLTLWLFGPATIYFTNVLEFSYRFAWAAPWLLAGAAAGFLLLAGLLVLLPRRLLPRATALLLALALLLWLQGTFLVWNYGPLDGRDIPWGRLWLRGVLDGGLWLGLIGWALWRPRGLARQARGAALLLIALQALWLGWLVVRAPAVPSFQHYELDVSGKYSFSRGRNAVLLVLDTFQSDVFQELCSQDPGLRRRWAGFTYYRNALSAAPKTFTAVPALLTGRAYDNSQPLLDFIADAYRDPASLPRRLGAAGFRVELYPYPGTEKTVFFDESVAANMKRRSSSRVLAGQLGLLADISLFRQLPHLLKPFVYNDQAWLLKRLLAAPPDYAQAAPRFRWDRSFDARALELPDVQFVSQLRANAEASGEKPVFKYFHLNGLHRPLVLDGQLRVRPMANNSRAAFLDQGRAALEIARLTLEKLRALGVYDDSLIVVMGDHGNADYPFGVNLAGTGLQETGANRIPVHIKGSALPLLLVKPPRAGNGDLVTSDAPVSGTDLPRTVAAALGLADAGMEGRDMAAVPAGEPRRRTFYYYNWNGWGDRYLYSMREYEVNGHAWLDGSWREVGVRRPGDSGAVYRAGTVLHFTREGNAMPFQGIGWHAPEKAGFTWTRERRAELFMTIGPPRRDLVLHLLARPYLVPGRLESQRLAVRVNGRPAGRFTLDQPGAARLKVAIPRTLLGHTGSLHIVFELPDAAAPADLGRGNDIRFLGMAVYALVLGEADPGAPRLPLPPPGGSRP